MIHIVFQQNDIDTLKKAIELDELCRVKSFRSKMILQ